MRALRSASWLPRYHRAKVLQRSSRQSELLENSSPSRTLSPPEVKKMCNLAQFWANHLAHANTFYYRNYRDIGENLFCRCSFVPEFDVTGEQVVKYWYRERKLYDFDKQPSLLHAKAGHFTQMVWRSSKEFGVGKARSRFGKIIVVANYKPAGNVTGEFQDNVFSPTKDDHLGNLDNG
ncbi:pathogenesis-related protein 1A-like isoform X2 [Limulus polyphemus]|uniref:Pathogenesis-related protein 1A-like isoform X2 n=1 Tax=Limulus polyphemus TaxID=6850 RepID=A0ABM1TRS9_LIMPO|nr:pathogenesis-related protein 1A-like isoform X2 [Limulus polyphemus]